MRAKCHKNCLENLACRYRHDRRSSIFLLDHMTMSTSKLLPKPPTTSASGTQTEANEVCKPHRHRARGGRRRGRKPHVSVVGLLIVPCLTFCSRRKSKINWRRQTKLKRRASNVSGFKASKTNLHNFAVVAAEPPPPTLAEMSEDVREELNTIASAFADLVTLNDDGRVYVALANGVDIVFTLPTGYPSRLECILAISII